MSIFSHGTDEYSRLSIAEKAAVDAVIAECHRTKKMARASYGAGGEVYAYPHTRGIAWGLNNPLNSARGIKS
jgi:hypothetical protein